jgi:hypothetical protein
LRLPQCAAGRPLAIGRSRACREPDDIHIAFLTAVPGDDLAIERLRIDQANPRHPECTRVDGDPAGFPE